MTRTWDCGCVSDNVALTPCPEHAGPVGTATNLRADDPRLNVVFGPTYVTLKFKDAQGGDAHYTALLGREAVFKALHLLTSLDETLDLDEIDD